MATSPEREKPRVPKEVTEHPVEISPEVEKAGATVTPSQVTAQVTDDQGKQLVQAPATQIVTIQIPAAQGQLEDWSHGSPSNSLTWYAAYWLRMVKKAMLYGWNIVQGKGSTNA